MERVAGASLHLRQSHQSQSKYLFCGRIILCAGSICQFFQAVIEFWILKYTNLLFSYKTFYTCVENQNNYFN